MNDYEAKERLYQQTRAQRANTVGQMDCSTLAGNAAGIGINYPDAPCVQTSVADALLKELSILIEKAVAIQNRQIGMRNKLFGDSPTRGEDNGKCPVVPSGFVAEAGEKLRILHLLMDGISENCTVLERLA